jgi:hypothetical protein
LCALDAIYWCKAARLSKNIAQRGGVPLFGEPLQQNIVVSKAVAFGFF